MVVTRHLCIFGHVQGVGYRDALRRQSLALGIAGWVRNRRDGSVEAVVQGDEAAVAKLVAWAERGPPAARVERVESHAASGEYDRSYAGFDWLATL